MTTAIMQSTLYNFGDLLLKNQNVSRTMTHLQQQQSALAAPTSAQSMLGASMPLLNNLSNSQLNSALLANNTNNASNLLLNQMNNNTIAQSAISPPQTPNGNTSTVLLQQQLSNAAAVMLQQQQQKQQLLLHNALTRAVSNPQGNNNVVSIMSSLIENFGAVGGAAHRKLERTQSEPIPQVNTSRYKTELCRPFEEAGECKYGEKCQFAHGIHELRNLQRHPKYKTEYCRTFHSVGFCPYGPRCHFVHNAEEARNHNRAVHAAYARAAAAAGQPMPLSPPLSMSTGSDRASPTGSLSPTNSTANFFPSSAGAEQTSPSAYQSSVAFQFPINIQNSSSMIQTPPVSPVNLSPIASPPPPMPITPPPTGEIDQRLPIFNQLSSTLEALNNLGM